MNYKNFTFSFTSEIIVDKAVNYLSGDEGFYVIDDFFKINYHKGISIKADETTKNLTTVYTILEKLFSSSQKRSDKIITIGGGITLDIAAFCASIYKRGCELWFIPTTIIGMIDASVGGKTGVNFEIRDNILKNQIGSFYPASKVILDFDFLQTLPEKEIKNGFSELIKMMIIFERDFFEKDFDFIRNNLSDYLLRAINYKLDICSKDLTDKEERQFLNLGHTFAHLIETVTDFRISHGDAVAKGLCLALKYSLDKGLLSDKCYHIIINYIKEFCNDIVLSTVEIEKLGLQGVDILFADKKAEQKIKLILVNDKSVEFFYVDDVRGLLDFVICFLGNEQL